jgi:hypothetical protein
MTKRWYYSILGSDSQYSRSVCFLRPLDMGLADKAAPTLSKGGVLQA